MKRFGVGVIGTGIMGRRMLVGLQRHARFRVAALWDARADAARIASAEFGDARCADSLDDLVNDPDVDIVYVASPPAFHLQGVQAATAARRACFCEKPLAHSVAEALAVRDLVAASALPFAVNFPLARAEATRRLTDLVHGGSLGEIERVTLTMRFARWPREWQAAASDWLAGPVEGGFTREVISHFIFLAHRLFGAGSVEGAVLERAPGQTETRLQARLVHDSATLLIDAAVGGDVADHNRFEIVGRRGSVALTSWYCVEYLGETSARVEPTSANLDGLAALLEGRPDHGLASVDEALAVVRCVEAMLRP